MQNIALGMQNINLDDGNYKKDRHDGLRFTSENYKSYFDSKSPTKDTFSPGPRRGHTTLDIRREPLSEDVTLELPDNS